jgi:hypothetical protein
LLINLILFTLFFRLVGSDFGAVAAAIHGEWLFVHKIVQLTSRKKPTVQEVTIHLKNLSFKQLEILGVSSSCSCVVPNSTKCIPALSTAEIRLQVQVPSGLTEVKELSRLKFFLSAGEPIEVGIEAKPSPEISESTVGEATADRLR